MGQYKVPQDVESEDKLLGPLSLRQFIYVLIALAWGGLIWRIFSLLGLNVVFMIVAILPVSGLFLLLGIGRRAEQSFESYFVAMIRFAFVPRIRVWDKDLSTDSVVKEEEKKPEVIDTKTVSKSSLEQLAMIMDTHGNRKDSTIQLHDGTNPTDVYAQRVIGPTQVAAVGGGNSSYSNLPQGATTKDDVLNESGKRSEQVGALLQNSEAKIYNQALENTQKGMTTLQQQLQAKQVNYAPANPSQQSTPDDIIKKAMLQSNSLNLQQISKQVARNSQGVLSEGQAVNIQPVKSQ